MFCRFCGNIIDFGNKYCSKCGKDLSSINNNELSEKNMPKINEQKFNIRKFSLFIVLIGMLVLAYGIIGYFNNQPIQYSPSNSRQTPFGRNDLGNYLSTRSENIERASARKGKVKIIYYGGIIILIGFAVFVSTKKAIR